MYVITQTIDRLRELCPPPTFRAIGGSADLAAAVDSAPATPSAFVILLAEQAADPYLVTQPVQVVTTHISVVICVANRRDATGGAAATDLQPLRQAVRQALLGWVPDDELGDQMQYASGRLMQFADGRLWWADEYSVMTRIY